MILVMVQDNGYYINVACGFTLQILKDLSTFLDKVGAALFNATFPSSPQKCKHMPGPCITTPLVKTIYKQLCQYR